jgi:hypothetical protein
MLRSEHRHADSSGRGSPFGQSPRLEGCCGRRFRSAARRPLRSNTLRRELAARYACNAPPRGVLVAVDLNAGKILWQSTVGTAEDRAPLGIPFHWGASLVNGVLVTGGGLVFTGATDAYLRAFDAKSGAELWQGRLPVPAIANPMAYIRGAEQYVVIGAGGLATPRWAPRSAQRRSLPLGAGG